MLFSNINMVSNINLNFSFTSPLSYGKNKIGIPKTRSEYVNLGFETYSLVYNTQNVIVSVILILLIAKILERIEPHMKKAQNNIGRKLHTMISKFVESKYDVVHELYYQQRMYIYFSLFEFINLLNPKDYQQGRHVLLLADTMLAAIFVYFDTAIVRSWINYILSFSYPQDEDKSHPFISLQQELSACKPTNGKQELQIIMIVFQFLYPLVLNLFINIKLQLVTVGIVFIGMATHIAARVRFSESKRMMICYFTNYFVLFLFCLVWGLTNLHDKVEDNTICGWILNSFLLIPTIITGVLYLPQIIKDTILSAKKAITNIKQMCRKKSAL